MFSFGKRAGDRASQLIPEEYEVVDLADIDLEFAVEEALAPVGQEKQAAAPAVISPMVAVPATADELAGVELFRGIEPAQLAEFAPLCQSIRVVPGFVFYPVGRFNTRLFCVLEGQLRLYAAQGEKRPRAIVDIGQTCGLAEALAMQPADHSLIATEATQVLAIEANMLTKLTARSHVFAQNYTALMASYTRGENCLHLGKGGKPSADRGGYIDPATLLHNQHWLETMFPRMVERSRKSGTPLAVVALRVDRLEAIDRESGVVLSPFVLEMLGRLMVEHSRPTDLHVVDSSRRLLAVLPDTSLEGARALANRIREQMTNVSAIDDLPLPPITLSMGIVELGAEEAPAALLTRAEALIEKSVAAGGACLHE